MICKQCGANMVLFREKEVFHCEYCGAYHFPPRSQEGIRQFGENKEKIVCPVCRDPLNQVTFYDRYRGYQCGTCRGILFNRKTFRKKVKERRASATTPAIIPERFESDELHRRVTCPKCKHEMSTHPYMGPGNIIIDTCEVCDYIWLDHGEINKVLNAPGRDRNGPPTAEEKMRNEYARQQKKAEKLRKKRNKKMKKMGKKVAFGLFDLLEDILD